MNELSRTGFHLGTRPCTKTVLLDSEVRIFLEEIIEGYTIGPSSIWKYFDVKGWQGMQGSGKKKIMLGNS